MPRRRTSGDNPETEETPTEEPKPEIEKPPEPEPPPEPKPESKKEESKPKKRTFTPSEKVARVCVVCGDKKATGLDGNPKCPSKNPDCPYLS